MVRLAPDAAPIDLGEKLRQALGRMLLEPGVTFTTRVLADEVWLDEKALRNPVNTVHQAMKGLRARLGDDAHEVIVSVESGYRLAVADPLWIDAERFRALVRRGRALAAEHPRAARAMFAEALGCWRGPVLGDHGRLRWAAGHAVELASLRESVEVDFNERAARAGRARGARGRAAAPDPRSTRTTSAGARSSSARSTATGARPRPASPTARPRAISARSARSCAGWATGSAAACVPTRRRSAPVGSTPGPGRDAALGAARAARPRATMTPGSARSPCWSTVTAACRTRSASDQLVAGFADPQAAVGAADGARRRRAPAARGRRCTPAASSRSATGSPARRPRAPGCSPRPRITGRCSCRSTPTRAWTISHRAARARRAAARRPAAGRAVVRARTGGDVPGARHAQLPSRTTCPSSRRASSAGRASSPRCRAHSAPGSW